MKRIRLMTFGIFATLIVPVAPQAQAGGGEEEVEALVRGLQKHWNAGNMTAYMAAYVENDGLRLLSSAGIYEGWDTVNTLYREQFPDEERMGDFTIDSLEVRLLTEDVALANGAFEHVFTEQTIRGSFSHVLKRRDDGRWLIELEHVSRSEVVTTGEK